MTCLSELTCAVYVDGELSPDETRDTERHLAECARCRALVAALRGENRAPRRGARRAGGACARERPGGEAGVGPQFCGGVATNGRRARAWGVVVAALVRWSRAGVAGLAGWGDLPGGPASVTMGDWIGLAVEAGLFVMTNVATLERTLGTLAVVAMAGLALAGSLYLARTPARAVVTLALALGVAAAVPPSSAEALEARSGRDVVVGAGETLDGDAGRRRRERPGRRDDRWRSDRRRGARRRAGNGARRSRGRGPDRGGGRHGGGERVCRRRLVHAPRPRGPGALRRGSHDGDRARSARRRRPRARRAGA